MLIAYERGTIERAALDADETEHIVLIFDARARFGDLPGVSATDA